MNMIDRLGKERDNLYGVVATGDEDSAVVAMSNIKQHVADIEKCKKLIPSLEAAVAAATAVCTKHLPLLKRNAEVARKKLVEASFVELEHSKKLEELTQKRLAWEEEHRACRQCTSKKGTCAVM